ncbi:protein gamma response 1 [Dorcoceras hygrometricum]|uniref:Protein gamma response 1 n=1 Tax=Dorcoceras hygrometricum TaxID=472368 RepID=A0A2Z7BW17_9LAMI|nr:protein gamma response 1 [Dorcoceras hygrometricum]
MTVLPLNSGKPRTCVTLNGSGIQLAVGPQPLRLRNHNSGLAQRIMVKRLATSPHDPLGITDSACKNQSVVVSVQYGPFNPYIPIRSTTIGKSRVAIDPIAMHTSWRSNIDIASVTSIGYPPMSASGESSTTMHRLLHASWSHPIPTPYEPKTNQYNQDLGLIHSTNGNHLESPKEGSSIDHQSLNDVRVVRTNQYNQDLGLIHSTNGNHLESPKEGSSIDHQVTIYLHAQNITMFPTNETWMFRTFTFGELVPGHDYSAKGDSPAMVEQLQSSNPFHDRNLNPSLVCTRKPVKISRTEPPVYTVRTNSSNGSGTTTAKSVASGDNGWEGGGRSKQEELQSDFALKEKPDVGYRRKPAVAKKEKSVVALHKIFRPRNKPAVGRHGSVVALTRCINQLQRKEEFEAAVALRKSYQLSEKPDVGYRRKPAVANKEKSVVALHKIFRRRNKPAVGRHGSAVALTRCINQLQRKEEFEAAVALRKSYQLSV